MNKPKVYLAGVHIKSESLEEAQELQRELAALTETLGYEIVGMALQSRATFDSQGYIGKGKQQEIKEVVEAEGVDLVFFDHDLTPKQSKYLEKSLDCQVWDRTQVILEIFAEHACTAEAKIQVELARLYYSLPRLVGLWAHLDRETGGIAFGKGMGEKQINIDRNLIRKRINLLEKQLKRIDQERRTQSKQRDGCLKVSLVGYTNAGKSSLMNVLAEEELLSEDKLFATLESTTRIIKDLTKPEIILSDTVGFIRNLPHSLVASFRSTLSVIKEADLLLHVIDPSNPCFELHIETTLKVLEEIGAHKIPQILVFNKADLVPDKMDQLILRNSYPDSVLLSAYKPESRDLLCEKIRKHFLQDFIQSETILSYDHSDLVAQFYKLSIIDTIKYEEDGIHLSYKSTNTNHKKLAFLLGEEEAREPWEQVIL